MTADRRPLATDDMGPHRAHFRFQRLASAFCHPDRISALLPEGLPAGFRERLQGSGRLRPRLSALIERRFALAACQADDLLTPEGRFASLEGEALTSAILGVGAIWHAERIRRIILAEHLRRLVERLGRDNHRRALRLIDLAAPDGGEAGEDEPDLDVLFALIERDGIRAINAWCCLQAGAIAGRLRLKLPPGEDADGEPPAAFRERGAMIVDRVAISLTATSDDGPG